MKILQWNIWFKEDINNIVKELKRIDADIVCIQELCYYGNDKRNVEILSAVYPHFYYEVADTLVGDRNICNAILSKYPFISTFKSYIQEPGENKKDFSKEGRIYIEVSVKKDSNLYNIGTAHLSYTHRFDETKEKDVEIENLINVIKEKERYLFLGDLNAKKTSKYIRNIEKYYINHDTENTWTTKPFSYNGFVADGLDWKLDYVFTSPDIKVQSVEVIKTDYSDHLPLLCTINE